MPCPRVVFSYLLQSLVLLLVTSSAAAQEPTGPEAEAAKRFQLHAQEMAEAYIVRAGDENGPMLAVGEKPLLRWSNPLGGRQAHGEVYLWTDRGRPAAVVSMYEYTDARSQVHEHHEWCSLAVNPIHATGPKIWTPRQPGVEWKPFAQDTPPESSPTRRPRQMRELAARFSAEKTTRAEETRPLRLLTQPISRYAAPESDIADGALFALVEATDPEVFLLIEARREGEKLVWQYALARMNSITFRVNYQDQPAWEAPLLPWRDALNRRDLPYTAFQVR